MIELDMDYDEQTRMLRDMVRNFAAKEIAPLVDQFDRKDEFPRSLWPKFGELGLLAIAAKEEDGGGGQGYLQHCLVLEEIARVTASIAMSYGVHSSLVVDQLRRNGTRDQRRRFYPKLFSGEWVASIAMSEAESGSDLVSMRTTAQRRGDRYILNGTKTWITNGSHADFVLVYAKSDPSAGKRGITAFLVEKSRGGLRVGRKIDVFGQRGSGTAELVFEDCEVPAENILGGENQGVRVLMSGLDFERVIASSQAVGIMQASIDLALPYVHERRQFGVPIGEFQLMQGKLADMYANVSACRSYVRAAAIAADRGKITRHDAASLYLFTAERGTQNALQAMQTLGGNGYTNEYPAARFVRDAKLYEIGGGTAEVRRMLIGRELFAKSS